VETDHLSITKKVCQRFHVVARQLRLRGEYRSTVNVEDECDVQDLMHALLHQHFDDIGTDEWIPSYSNGVARTTYLLDHDRLAIVVKKTRSGLSRKDLADQVRTDVERYRDRGRCTHILCFIYDPEGRIGNPRGLESELSTTSEHFAVDVVVAPK
jgi:REase_DpnII-MboI